MKIAELFVNLGVKGLDTASAGLGKVRSGFSAITSTSLETKAAILGVLYGLERLTSQSAQAGTSLLQFENITGASGDKLQRWQYLMLQSRVPAEKFKSDVISLQGVMSKMVTGQGAPAGFGAFINRVTDFDQSKARDLFYVLDKLREYAQKTKDIPDIRNQALSTFGLSLETIQALATSTVDLNKIPVSRLYTEAEIRRLNSVGVGFGNIGDKLNHAFGKVTARFGPKIVTDLDKMTNSVVNLVTAFAQLNKEIDGIGMLSKGILFLADAIQTLANVTKDHRLLLKPFLGDIPSPETVGKPPLGPMKVPDWLNKMGNPVTINISAPITGVADVEDAGEQLGKAVNDAFRPFQQGGGY